MRAKELRIGDLVVASKYRDGYSRDHFCVGFYGGTTDRSGEVRHVVQDELGASFRLNGFIRCQRVSERRWAWFAKNIKRIHESRRSIWFFVRCPMDYFERKHKWRVDYRAMKCVTRAGGRLDWEWSEWTETETFDRNKDAMKATRIANSLPFVKSFEWRVKAI